MRKFVIVFVFLGTGSFLFAQSDGGGYWSGLNQDQKLGFVMGLIYGAVSEYYRVSHVDEDFKDMSTLQHLMQKTDKADLLNLYKYDKDVFLLLHWANSPQTMVKTLDSYYKDSNHYSVSVRFAFFSIVRDYFKGHEQEMNKYVEFLSVPIVTKPAIGSPNVTGLKEIVEHFYVNGRITDANVQRYYVNDKNQTIYSCFLNDDMSPRSWTFCSYDTSGNQIETQLFDITDGKLKRWVHTRVTVENNGDNTTYKTYTSYYEKEEKLAETKIMSSK